VDAGPRQRICALYFTAPNQMIVASYIPPALIRRSHLPSFRALLNHALQWNAERPETAPSFTDRSYHLFRKTAQNFGRAILTKKKGDGSAGPHTSHRSWKHRSYTGQNRNCTQQLK